mmetsp:Transcript_99703/g.259924  ORF Transcript_99703/g.259924 Transcript_99703/m.259924 type:complete len:478 (+) Transcript_99703:1219-2652(+)
MFGSDVLEQLHNVGGREEVAAHHPRGVLQHGGDVVDVEATGVGAYEGVWAHVLLHVQEHLLLEIHDLWHRLDHHVNIGEVLVLERRLDEVYQLLELVLRNLAPLRLGPPEPLDLLEPVAQPLLLGVLQHHRHALLREAHGDAAAHQPRAQDADLLDGGWLGGEARHLLGGPFREEEVLQRLRLQAKHEFGELLRLHLEPVPEAVLVGACSPQALHDGLGRHHPGRSLVRHDERLIQRTAHGHHLVLEGHLALRHGARLPAQRERRRLADDVVALRYRVHDAVLLRLVYLHGLAHDAQLDGHGQGRHAGYALRALPAGQEAQVDLREAHGGLRRGQAVVAGEGQLEPTAQGRAVHGGHGGLRRGVDHVEHLVEGHRRRHLLVGLLAHHKPFGELRDLRAAAEEAVGARDDDGLHLWVVQQLRELLLERQDERLAKRVHGLVVESDDADAVGPHADGGGHCSRWVAALGEGGAPRNTLP